MDKISANYDVVVCGGGPAGFIAAITTARSGARTISADKTAFASLRVQSLKTRNNT